jgi:hypothetical protein
MCDAVQAESYVIDGIPVSNFVLPLYFTRTRTIDEHGTRNDFLGSIYDNRTLGSFGINPGSYVGFYDPVLQCHEIFTRKGDEVARNSMKVKLAMELACRSVRYQHTAEKLEIMQRDVMKRTTVMSARRARNLEPRVEYQAV